MELKPKQRAYLRSLANTLTPVFQIGKGGITDTMIEELINVIEKRELIKVKILNNSDYSAKDAAQEIAMSMDVVVVQVIGSVVTLYYPSSNPKYRKIELPR